MTKTYIENESVPQIPEEYSEENLRKKFARQQEELWKEIESNLEYYTSLRNMEKEYKEDGSDTIYFSNDDLQNELKNIRLETENYRKETDGIKAEAKLLKKYGKAFARLYYIKDEHEKRGYDEKLSFTEVDVTGNGDIITDNQHYGMSYNPEGRLTQPALTVKVDDDLQFNVGMMEFNKPNSATEVKLQISFDEETTENLDVEKINAVFDFCEKYGFSSSDMIVRRFDGSIDDGAIQEKINYLMEEAAKKRAEADKKADEKEFSEQNTREKELVKEIEAEVEKHGGKLSKGLSLEEAINEANKILPEDKRLDIEDISADLPASDMVLKAENRDAKASFKDVHLKNKALPENKFEAADVADTTTQEPQSFTSEATQTPDSVSVPQQNKAPVKKTKKPLEKAEEQFEKYFEKGLAKRRRYSYFKTYTGCFFKGWTEYIIYDTEDRHNRRKDGVKDSKSGNVRYTYSFKFFIRQDKDGNLHFAYRTPNHKPINEDIVGGIAGQLKDLGFTHLNFTGNIPDKEKGIWRKALAEKGIVPVGMSLDRSKAEGMIKAAKEKLSSEEFSNFKYRLALQMDKNNKAKGKNVDKSEQDFIDGLLMARKYEAFSSGYSEVLKGKITRLVHPEVERENGAVEKIAAMANLRRLFNAFKIGVETGSILNSRVLTDREKDLIRNSPDLLGNPSKFNGSEFSQLYDIMFPESCKNAKIELEKKFREPGAKRAHETIKKGQFNAAYNSCKSIIKELKALGVDEIDLPETTDNLPYNAPDLSKPNPTPTQTKPNTNTGAAVAAAHSFERADR